MKLRDFVEREEILIKAFVSHWIDNHQSDPEDFPGELELEDWVEQFETFRTDLLTDGWVKVTWTNDALRDTRRGGCRETIKSVQVIHKLKDRKL